MRSVQATGDPISQFFAVLAEAGNIASFAGESASLRFDVSDDGHLEHWHLTVTKGDVLVSRRSSSADAIVRVRRPDIEAIVTGRLNAQAALLRGLISCEGSVSALMMFQRCLPGPPGSKGRVAPIRSQAVMAQRRAL